MNLEQHLLDWYREDILAAVRKEVCLYFIKGEWSFIDNIKQRACKALAPW